MTWLDYLLVGLDITLILLAILAIMAFTSPIRNDMD